jgi:hypothetical protein
MLCNSSGPDCIISNHFHHLLAMKAFNSRTAVSVIFFALTAASSLRAGPGVDYWMRKHVFPAQAKATANAANTEQSVSTDSSKKVEVTKIEHAYRGVPHQVVVQVPVNPPATSTASLEKPVESSPSPSRASSSSAVIH